MIQLRLREMALLRQGQLSEPTASSDPAAMLLAISRNLSCFPRRSPCPDRYPLPQASLSAAMLLTGSRRPSNIPNRVLPDPMPSPPGIRSFNIRSFLLTKKSQPSARHQPCQGTRTQNQSYNNLIILQYYTNNLSHFPYTALDLHPEIYVS